MQPADTPENEKNDESIDNEENAQRQTSQNGAQAIYTNLQFKSWRHINVMIFHHCKLLRGQPPTLETLIRRPRPKTPSFSEKRDRARRQKSRVGSKRGLKRNVRNSLGETKQSRLSTRAGPIGIKHLGEKTLTLTNRTLVVGVDICNRGWLQRRT